MKLKSIALSLCFSAPLFSAHSNAESQTSLWVGDFSLWKIGKDAVTASVKHDRKPAGPSSLILKEPTKNFELSFKFPANLQAGESAKVVWGRTANGASSAYQLQLGSHPELGSILASTSGDIVAKRGTLTKIGMNDDRHVFAFCKSTELNVFVEGRTWHEYKVIVRGSRAEVHINGILFASLDEAGAHHPDAKGYLALEVDANQGPGNFEFKDFRLRRISDRPAASIKTPNEATKPERLQISPLLWDLEPNMSPNKDDVTSQMHIPNGFHVETIASEPLLRQPIAFTFDGRGRIWVAEAFAYPRRQPKGAGKDRLIILEDADQDGTYETHKVFADNLNLISGFEIGYGGVFVACAPEFLFIPDADEDDVPDGPAKVLLDGFSVKDTHETPNSFIWGHDGWLYGCHGVFNPSFVGKPGTPREDRIPMKAAVWRFHPVSHQFEIYSHGGSNQWGLDYDASGSLFMTHCRSSWGLGPVSQVFRDGHYWTQNNQNHQAYIAAGPRGWNRSKIPLINFFESISAYGHGKGGAGDQDSRSIFGGHSHVGVMVYLGDNWPEQYRGQLYTHNLHGHQLNRERLSPWDSGRLASSHGQDMLYSPDKKYLAVDLKYGPDGAVYSIDWRDTQQCHVNKTEVWDRSNGRLYRMAWAEDYKPSKSFNYAKAKDKELMGFLSHTNEWYARMAQHEIRQRAARNSLSKELVRMLRDVVFHPTSEHRFRHLIALHAAGNLSEPDYQKLLTDSDAIIRNHALHLLTDQPGTVTNAFQKGLLEMAKKEPSASVRLTLAGACQHRLPQSIRVPVLQMLSRRAEDARDRFIPKMIWFGLASNAGTNLELLAEVAQQTPQPMLRDSILWHLSKHRPDLAIQIAAQLREPGDLTRAAGAISQSLKKRTIQAPESWASFSDQLRKIDTPASTAHLKQLETVFGVRNLQPTNGDTRAQRIKRAEAAFAVCAACHQPGMDQLGPSLEEIVTIYDNKKSIIDWVKKPVKKREKYPLMPAFDKLDAKTLDLISEYLLHMGSVSGAK